MFEKLRRDEQGVAAVEFALWSTFIFAVLLGGFDFGLYAIQKARLAKSVSEASNFAFASRKSVDVDQIRDYIAKSSKLPGIQPTVTVTCNGGQACVDTNRSYACLSTSGALTASSKGSTCASGALAGYYMTIEARYTYQEPVMPSGYIDGARMVERSTIQLQ